MIGPGTGLAPFRGFLQERAARKAKGASLGPAMLFFGCRHPDQDYLYADELKAFAAAGITELHTAFSRAEGPKTYVQHLVAAQKDRVWSLIEQGAIIYVCGDGGKMEPDVKAALVAIYRERKGADAEAGLRWIDDLGTEQSLRAGCLGGGIGLPAVVSGEHDAGSDEDALPGHAAWLEVGHVSGSCSCSHPISRRCCFANCWNNFGGRIRLPIVVVDDGSGPAYSELFQRAGPGIRHHRPEKRRQPRQGCRAQAWHEPYPGEPSRLHRGGYCRCRWAARGGQTS